MAYPAFDEEQDLHSEPLIDNMHIAAKSNAKKFRRVVGKVGRRVSLLSQCVAALIPSTNNWP